ncbi:hypothetical protein [Hungatella sp.]|uniref:hypothetical protein n=1 Tax=Hungatella sp. TaxID=2613924 RepID=UPI002A7EF9CE|nr:hypothetical protein [Hungatella sp.]
MADIEVYRVKLDLSGELTQIPDSQKLFGALIYMYAEYTNDDTASGFVSKIKEKKIYFALSDLLPDNYLPIPQTFLLDELAISRERLDKKVYKAMKKRRYIEKEYLMNLVQKREEVEYAYPYIAIQDSQQIHASIDSLSYGLAGLDPNVYSVPQIRAVKIEKAGEESGSLVKNYEFYLAIEKCKEASDFLRILQLARQNKRPFFLGPRASQGMNIFYMGEVFFQSQFYQHNVKRYLNLGMLLPDKIDYGESSLHLFTSERRPYNKKEGWDNSYKRKFISFIQAGSVICVRETIREVGRSICNSEDEKTIIFGNSFLYPMEGDASDAYEKY